MNGNGAICINNSLRIVGCALDTQDRSSNLIRVINALFGRRRVEYLAARYFVYQDIAAIGVIDALEVGHKRGGTHFVVLEDIIQEDDNGSVSVELARNLAILGVVFVNEGQSCSILIGCVTDGWRREHLPCCSVEEVDPLGAIKFICRKYDLVGKLSFALEVNLGPVGGAHVQLLRAIDPTQDIATVCPDLYL